MSPHRRRLTPLLAAGILVLSACSTEGDDPATAELQTDLQQTREQQAQLSQRVAELEEALAPDEGATEDPLADLDRRIASLDDAVTQLRTALEAEVEARGAADASLGEDVAAFDSRLGDLQASVVELRGAVQELTDEVASLEAQFKAHRDDGGAHG